MRIHTDHDNLWTIVHDAAGTMPGVSATMTRHGSRSRAHGYELRLEGTSNRRPNPGTGRPREYDPDAHAATWDEWGVILAAIFEADPDAFAGSAKHPVYRDFDHFHYATGARFDSGGLPEDTHQDHRWEYSPAMGRHECKTCTAVRNR